MIVAQPVVPETALSRHNSTSKPRISYLGRPASGTQASGDPVLLLHGVGSSSETWGDLLPLLGDRRIIAPDYRGHGASDAPPPPYAMGDFVDDSLRLLDELAIGRVHVIGFSIGALFAERLAIDAPGRVRSIALLSSIANRTKEELARARARAGHIAATPPAQVAPKSAERWFTPAFRAERPDLVAREVEIVERTAHAPYASSYDVLVENDPIDDVRDIACPTLIMTGEHDEGSTPAMSQALHERIAKSRLVIVPGVKHYIHVERPQVIASEWLRFLQDIETPPSQAQPG